MKISEIVARLIQFGARMKKITVSGELCIDFVTQSDIRLEDLQQILAPVITQFKKDFPFLKIEIQPELYELTVKIFAYRRNLFDRGFLAQFQDHCKILLNEVCHERNVKVRLNVSGELQSFKNIEKFRYLNNHDQIYGQTEQIPLPNRFNRIAGG